jgi:hypothetical protein
MQSTQERQCVGRTHALGFRRAAARNDDV